MMTVTSHSHHHCHCHCDCDRDVDVESSNPATLRVDEFRLGNNCATFLRHAACGWYVACGTMCHGCTRAINAHFTFYASRCSMPNGSLIMLQIDMEISHNAAV